jgi:hypothetical protein
MKKLITPSDYARIKRMTVSQLNTWVLTLYASAYEEGEEAYKDDVIVGEEDFRAILREYGVKEPDIDSILERMSHCG